MTPRQIYGDLAKIAGHICENDMRFIETTRVTKEHLQIVQGRIRALMEKLQYDRTMRDFPFPRRPRSRTLREELMAATETARNEEVPAMRAAYDQVSINSMSSSLWSTSLTPPTLDGTVPGNQVNEINPSVVEYDVVEENPFDSSGPI